MNDRIREERVFERKKTEMSGAMTISPSIYSYLSGVTVESARWFNWANKGQSNG